jgi:hypothetical protein
MDVVGKGYAMHNQRLSLRRSRTIVSSLILFLLVAVHGFGQGAAPSGVVQGVVVDVDGKPLSKATVYGIPQENMTRPIYTTSDSEGKFTIHGLPAGPVYLDASKDSDGYPYSIFSFFIMPGQVKPKVNVKEGETITGVVVRLGARAAYLRLAISDEDGTPLNADVLFTRSDMPGHSGDYRTSVLPKETLMVPPVPFRVTVEAKGYKPWQYAGEHEQEKEGVIALKPGETFDLVVHLKKIE